MKIIGKCLLGIVFLLYYYYSTPWNHQNMIDFMRYKTWSIVALRLGQFDSIGFCFKLCHQKWFLKNTIQLISKINSKFCRTKLGRSECFCFTSPPCWLVMFINHKNIWFASINDSCLLVCNPNEAHCHVSFVICLITMDLFVICIKTLWNFIFLLLF